MKIELPKGVYVHEEYAIARQECENLIPVAQSAPTYSDVQLLGRAGVAELATCGDDDTAVCRGVATLDGVPYIVCGEKLFVLLYSMSYGTYYTVEKGTIVGSARVSMADNGTQLMILVPGNKGYVYTDSWGLQEITDSDFTANGAPQYVAFIDGYFVCTTDTKKWIKSALNDGLSWDALDRGTAESDPDSVVAPVVYGNQVYLTGTRTTEGFSNVGGSGFPFLRNNVVLDKGCAAPLSLVATNGAFFMIGRGKNERPSVWAYKGAEYEKISNQAIDDVLQAYDDATIYEAYALQFTDKGQHLISFTVGSHTLVYNLSTNLWNEFSSYVYTYGKYTKNKWAVNGVVSAYDKILFTSSYDNKVGELSNSAVYDWDRPFYHIFSTPVVYNGGVSFRVPKIELLAKTDMTLSTEQTIDLELTRDMRTYGTPKTRTMGKVGRYDKRIVWRRNGRFSALGAFRFRFTGAANVNILRLDAEVV